MLAYWWAVSYSAGALNFAPNRALSATRIDFCIIRQLPGPCRPGMFVTVFQVPTTLTSYIYRS